jgi:hypothetical protein
VDNQLANAPGESRSGLRRVFVVLRNIWAWIGNDKVALLLLGFLLTGITGSYINARFQQASWERQKQFEVLRHNLDSGFTLVEQLSSSINNRLFGLQRVLWATESNPAELDRLWKEYYGFVIEWNRTLNTNQMKVLRLLGEDEARALLDYADEQRPEAPQSIHGRLRLAHDRILAAKECVASSCKDRAARLASAKEVLDQLDIHSDAFVERLTQVLLQRAESMRFN